MSRILRATWASIVAGMLTIPVAADLALETTESADAKNVRMAWWREAKFGMFIHWGVYAVPAGVYDGKPVDGIGEWIMLNGEIPVDRYKSYAQGFNAAKYDPKAWADLAAEAGMRYVIITAKHHDGFALYPSDVSTWDVADASPANRDLIAPFAEASRARGLRFGLYYSQAQDWVHAGGAKARRNEGQPGWDPVQDGSFDTYLDQVAVPQVREILTRYQPDVLWWDTPLQMSRERAAKLAPLLSLKPGIIQNNRLGDGFGGDTETPEQVIPDQGFQDRDWETCMTMNDTWGFKLNDHNWKPASVLIRNLVDIASKGGNYLLNVGPTAEGEIPAESVRLLKEVGAWMKVNGDAIYGTKGSPFGNLPWGGCTTRPGNGSTTMYLHIFNWPVDGKLLLPNLENKVSSAEWLAGGDQVPWSHTGHGLVLELPARGPDTISSTIRLVIEGEPNLLAPLVTPREDGTIQLFPSMANFRGGLRIEEFEGKDNIGFWTHPHDSVSWSLQTSREGRYDLNIEASAPQEGSALKVHILGKLAYSVPKTDGYLDYRLTKVGEIDLPKDQKITVTLRPIVDGWKPVNVRKVELVPQP